MSERHYAIKQTLDKGYASEWNNDHFCDFTDRINYTGTMFLASLANFWNTAHETSITASTINWDNIDVGLRLRAAGGVGNFASVRFKVCNVISNMTNIGQAPIWNASVNVFTPTNDANTHEFGMIAVAQNPFTANQDGAFFRISNNQLFAVTGDGAAETATNVGAPNQYGHYRIELDTAECKFYVDDLETPVATHTVIAGQNLPNNDMTVKFHTAQRAAGVNDMDIHAWGISVLRTQ